MNVTIKDVAERAGVAPSTVSRVLSDSKSISDKTKEKVRKAMAELHYYPNLTARSLVSKRSKVIGLVLPQASDAFYQNPFFPTVLRGINEVAAENGFSLLLNTGNGDQERLRHIQRMVNGRLVDGLIFLYAIEDDPIINFVRQSATPFVIIGQATDWQTNFVDNNNVDLGLLATQYLIDQGKKNIAFIGSAYPQIFVKSRYQGYQKAHEASHLEANPDWIFRPDQFLVKNGFEMAREVAAIPEIDAAVIVDQLVARGFKEGVRYVCPDRQIAAMTFKPYRSDFSQSIHQAYININAIELGKRAFQVLFDALNDQHSDQEIRYYHEIVKAELVQGNAD